MKYEIEDYIPFMNDNDNFFSDPSKLNDDFKISLPSSKWKKHKNKYWIFLENQEFLIPDQGWKIHISAGYNNSELQSILNCVSNYLFDNNIWFKVTISYQEWILKNSKSADRIGAGKFITVYPKDEVEFRKTVKQLADLLKKYKVGPYILSDKRYGNTNIYYRYGGFREIRNSNGELCIRDNNGKLIPDKRAPFYQKPSFIKDPFEKEIKNKVDKVSNKEKLDSYNISAALHFSNAGGVYLGQRNGKKYVIKEGRKHAGIDSHKQDGFSRIRHESEFLEKASKSPYVVKIKDHFKVWIHYYLVEDYLPLKSLGDFITDNFPVHDENTKYFALIKKIAKNLVKSLDDLHQRGIAVGDLQPDNILISDDCEKLFLIDLEQANYVKAAYDPGLKTVGFVGENISIDTYEQEDWIAAYKTIRYALEPIINIDSLTTTSELYRNRNLLKYRKEVLYFINKFKLECFNKGQLKEINDTSVIMPVNLNNLNSTITKIKKGITANLDPINSESIRGDIDQFLSFSGKYNVINGIMGLGLISKNKDEKIERLFLKLYLKNQAEIMQGINLDPGLFTGAAGIGSIIYNHINKSLGKKIIDSINYKELTDLSLKSGLAGIGLAKLALNQVEKSKERTLEIIKIANLVNVGYNNCSDLGLLEGKLGLILFLEKAGKYLNDSNLIQQAKKKIRSFLQKSISNNEEIYLLGIELDKESYLPYLNSGAAGLGLILLEFIHDGILSSEVDPIIKKIITTLDVNLTYMNGLFDGFSGLILVDIAAKYYRYQNSLSKKIDMLNNYLVIEKKDILVPGVYGLRDSMDLATGAIGLLTILQGIKENNWGKWIPVIQSKNFEIFKGGE